MVPTVLWLVLIFERNFIFQTRFFSDLYRKELPVSLASLHINKRGWFCSQGRLPRALRSAVKPFPLLVSTVPPWTSQLQASLPSLCPVSAIFYCTEDRFYFYFWFSMFWSDFQKKKQYLHISSLKPEVPFLPGSVRQVKGPLSTSIAICSRIVTP